jgi:hypothetical protein
MKAGVAATVMGKEQDELFMKLAIEQAQKEDGEAVCAGLAAGFLFSINIDP